MSGTATPVQMKSKLAVLPLPLNTRLLVKRGGCFKVVLILLELYWFLISHTFSLAFSGRE